MDVLGNVGQRRQVAGRDIDPLAARTGLAGQSRQLEQDVVGQSDVGLRVVDWDESLVAPPQVDAPPIEHLHPVGIAQLACTG